VRCVAGKPSCSRPPDPDSRRARSSLHALWPGTVARETAGPARAYCALHTEKSARADLRSLRHDSRLRDYIASDDAAAAMAAALRAASERPHVLTRIIASEQPTTIAEIIATFKRIARRAPRIITSASRLSGIYSRRARFRSAAVQDNAPLQQTSLLIGIARVIWRRNALRWCGRGLHDQSIRSIVSTPSAKHLPECAPA